MSRVAGAAVLLGIAALGAAALVWADGTPGRPAPAAAPVVNRGTLPSTALPSTALPTTHPSSPTPARRATVPAGSRLLLPRLHVDAPVGTVRAPGGVMQVPADPRRVAWWRDGAAPGDATGSAVLVGHINFDGVSGALAALPQLRPGDAVRLDEPGRALRYRVQAVRTYPKTAGIPADAFRRDGPARLVLITCGGPFDARSGNYEDNVVVYAVTI